MRLFWILKLLVGLGVLLAVGVFLLAVGAASTQLLVSDGVERFTGEQRAIAQDALISARIGCFDNPIAFVVYQKTRVVEMQFEPGRPLAVDFPTTCQDYRVVIQIYTFFGIPIGTISVCDDHVDCRESFWPERLWRPRLGERTQ